MLPLWGMILVSDLQVRSVAANVTWCDGIGKRDEFYTGERRHRDALVAERWKASGDGDPGPAGKGEKIRVEDPFRIMLADPRF